MEEQIKTKEDTLGVIKKTEERLKGIENKKQEIKNPEGNLSAETQEKIKNLEQSLGKWSQDINVAKEKLAKLPAGENEEMELAEVAELVASMTKECSEAEKMLSDAVYEEMYWDNEQSMGRREEGNQEYQSEGYQKWVSEFWKRENERMGIKEISQEEEQAIIAEQKEKTEGSHATIEKKEDEDKEEDMGKLDEKFLAQDFDKMAPLRINELSKEIEEFNKNAPLLAEKTNNLNSYISNTKQHIKHLRHDVSPQKASELEQEMDSRVGQENEEIKVLKHLVAVGKDAIINGEATIARYERALKNRGEEIKLSEEEKKRIGLEIEELHEKVKNLHLN